MKAMRWLAVVLILSASVAPASAEKFEEVAEVKVSVSPQNAKPGQTVAWTMTMKVVPGYHTYSVNQPPGDAEVYATKFKRPTDGDFFFTTELPDERGDPPAEPVPEMGVPVLEFHGDVTWTYQIVVSPKAKPGKTAINLKIKVQACNDKGCVQGNIPAAEFTVLDGPAEPVDPKYKGEVEKFLSTPKPPENPGNVVRAGPSDASKAVEGKFIAPPAATLDEHKANLELIKKQLEKFAEPTSSSNEGLGGFLVTAALWGLISLITPCVFPMIPITVSFFLKQSEREHHKPVRMALIYCVTIIVVLGVAAMTLLTTFRELSVHPLTNVALGALFVVFALSLFGLYNITLPQSLTNFTAAREGRGGALGTVFMALTFTIVSFTCVAPFLGGFAGLQATGEHSHLKLFLGAMTFSTAFAAPFFILALFPSLIKKLPKSGSWLNVVKVVMGFLELAAGLKFFRTAELRWLPSPQYFTYDLVMGIWIALAVICGLYLLNCFRLGHDEPVEHIGVGRMFLGLGFLALAIYLTPAIFKSEKGTGQRPGGVVFAWIDSFLLPEATAEDLPWSANLKGTVDAARDELNKSGKRQFIFLDNTGVSCTNCRYNEREVFRKGDVQHLFNQYRLVQHYTDGVPASFYNQQVDKNRRDDEAEANLQFQRIVFKDERLPLYATIEVTKETLRIVGVYRESKINDPNAFVEFLKSSMK